MNRCLGCMKEKDEYSSVCPHCGYVEGSAPDEIYHLTPGHFIHNKYVVGKALGYNDNTVTYIGMDYITDKTVIIKEFLPLKFSTRLPGEANVTVHKGSASDKFNAGINDFAQKAMKLVNLNSFNQSEGDIAPFDIFIENNTCYVVEEYGNGETLKNIFLQSGTMPYESVVAIINGVISLVSRLHSEGIYHGNLTADSILITPDNKIRLLNFSYTSGDAASDVFGIASILYRAITGIDVGTVSISGLASPISLGCEISTFANSAIILALKSKGNVSLSDFSEKINTKNDIVPDVISNDIPDNKPEEKKQAVSNTGFETEKKNKKPIIIASVIAAVLLITCVLGFVIANNIPKTSDNAITLEYSLDNGETFNTMEITDDDTNDAQTISGDGETVIFRVLKETDDTKVTLKCDDTEIQGISGNYTKEDKSGTCMEYAVDVADKDLCNITITFVLNSHKTTYKLTYKKVPLATLDSLAVKVDDADLIAYDKTQTEYTDIEVEAGKQVNFVYSAPDTHNVKVTCNDAEATENPVVITVEEEVTWTVTLTITAEDYKENTYTVKIKGVKPQESQKNKSGKKSSNKNYSTGGSSGGSASSEASNVEPADTNDGKVVVPNYVGKMDYNVGQSSSLKIVVRQDNSEKSLGEHKIWGQYPKAGTKVKKGSTVYLYVYYE